MFPVSRLRRPDADVARFFEFMHEIVYTRACYADGSLGQGTSTGILGGMAWVFWLWARMNG